MIEHVLKAGAAGMVGLVLGWGANSLTLGGRVDAIERGMIRIEAALYRLPDRINETPTK